MISHAFHHANGIFVPLASLLVYQVRDYSYPPTEILLADTVSGAI